MVQRHKNINTYTYSISSFQIGDDSNIHRDVYIVNNQCKEFAKYDWIGQLMGACLRGKENLVGKL